MAVASRYVSFAQAQHSRIVIVGCLLCYLLYKQHRACSLKVKGRRSLISAFPNAPMFIPWREDTRFYWGKQTSLRGGYLNKRDSFLYPLVATRGCCGGRADMNNNGNLLDYMALAFWTLADFVVGLVMSQLYIERALPAWWVDSEGQ